MKVEVKSAKPDFQTVTISITIESIAELAVLYARFNCPVAIIKQYGFGVDPISGRLARVADFSIEDSDESDRVFGHILDIAKGYHNKMLGLDIL
jgi:hypothetical protein